MCGRIACALAPETICRSCSYKDKQSGNYKQPSWEDHPPPKDPGTSYTYYPSANAAPTKFTPVLYKPTECKETSSEYVVTPMVFGMIPFWHKGDMKTHKLSTNNCRLEGLLSSKLYKRSLDQRKLCIVVAQGFYEWKTVGNDGKQRKQPYFIYAPQDDETIKVGEVSEWDNSEWDEIEGWKGPKILKMAGLYDVWTSPQGDKVFSYTVITMGSNETLSWLHDRMPAILETEEQVMGWLNSTTATDTKELLSILKPASCLKYYPVDFKVGNSRCHDIDCMKPLEKKVAKPNTLMDNWLKGTKRPKEEETTPDEKNKKPREG